MTDERLAELKREEMREIADEREKEEELLSSDSNIKHVEKAYLYENERKVGRSTNQMASLESRRSIHERLASNRRR